MNWINRHWELLFVLALSCYLVSCASTGRPSGGPKDTTPPSLVLEESAPNFSTNYKPRKIELVFDEWIELKNQQREILISPPFFKRPQINSRGKKVTVEFPEEEPLREDATYTINFGKSIVDFTEGNPAEGFRFVFATGDKIDSLAFKGSIEDARTGEAVKDILVLLYDVLGDSVVVSEKPFYYARTDETGNFNFENLKNDTFKVFVLEDLNYNYLLDAGAERLAFSDSLFVLNDSASFNPKLRLFTPEQRLRILESSSEVPGLIWTSFDRPSHEVDIEFLYPAGFEPIIEEDRDTLKIWHTEQVDSVGVIYGVDTLDFNIRPFDSIFYARPLIMYESNASRTALAPFDSLRLTFGSPLASVDTSLIRLTNVPESVVRDTSANSRKEGRRDSLLNDRLTIEVDSLPSDTTVFDKDVPTLEGDSTLIDTTIVKLDSILSDTLILPDSIDVDSSEVIADTLGQDSIVVAPDTALVAFDFDQVISMRDVMIKSSWKEKASYRLQLLPGALTDIYGRQNDTIQLEFKTAGLDEFGSIAINLSGLDSAQHYVVLLKLKDDIIKKDRVLDVDSTNIRIVHARLPVNTYSIELIKDDNNDGKWTTGDYWSKRQPEELKSFELEKLRQDWDLEASVFWNEPEGGIPGANSAVQDSLGTINPPANTEGRRPNPRGSKLERGGGKGIDKGKND